jgi:hypothetical protein
MHIFSFLFVIVVSSVSLWFLFPTFPGILCVIQKSYALILHSTFFIELQHGRRLDAIVLLLALITIWCIEMEA